MKSFLPWLVALVMLAAAAYLYSGNRKLATEVTALRTENTQVELLRAEVEQLKSNGSPAQAQEIVRLRKNSEELLKARNELQQLRGEKKELTKQAQTAQAQAQAAQAQAEAARGQVASISTNIQAVTAQALAEQQRALAERYGLATGTRGQAQVSCVHNLRMLDGAKQQWALENHKDATTTPQARDIVDYLKDGIPKCPDGGSYTIGAVGAVPTCSIPGHAVPQ